jgi:hypothetical protein
MDVKQLALVKDGERFVFRYADGGESAVLDSLIDMASDADCALDWFDAAVLSYQIGRALADPDKLNVASRSVSTRRRAKGQ